jgi:mitotic spindle assembly checkpoint protein MAD2
MSKPKDAKKEKASTHKLALKGKVSNSNTWRSLISAGSSKLVSEFFEYSINTILYQRGVYPIEDFHAVKKYGLNMLVTSDDQVKAYVKKIMGQLNKWMVGQKISRLVIVITGKESGEHVERWQFDVQINKDKAKGKTSGTTEKENSNPQ